MNETFRSKGREKRSSVLVLTLLILVLVSVIVLGLLASVTLEKQLAESNYQQRRALELSFMAYQNGVSQLRNALGTDTNSWDNPYANFCTNPPTFFWSVSPGMITRWSNTPTATGSTNLALFSYVSAANTNIVNLNRPLADGSYPIIGGASAPDVSVQFVNVLQDPSQAASAANPIIGRYAFWIDDESAKININVADGTQKYTTNSLGLGSPTEVSLQVLSQGGATLTQQLATNIVQMARTNSFHSPRELLNVSGVTSDLYTNNVFNVTDYSRSPDINIFGQPKMALLPILGGASPYSNLYGTNMVINGISLLAENEIYPTPSQLPNYYVTDPSPAYSASNPFPSAWPLAFRAQLPSTVMGPLYPDLTQDDICGRLNNYTFNNGLMISNYLAGKNSSGMPVNWPIFNGVTLSGGVASGFHGKYTNRQIDEIVMQVASISAKLTSSDYVYPNSLDFPAYNIQSSAEDSNVTGSQPYGYRYNFTPFHLSRLAE